MLGSTAVLGSTDRENIAPRPRLRMRPRWDLVILIAPLALLSAIVFDIPLLNTAFWAVSDPQSGALTDRYFREFVESRAYMRIIWRTLVMSLEVTAITVVLGYPLAYWTTRLAPRWRLLVLGLVVMTFWVSILVRTYAWIVILGNGGLVNRTLQWAGLSSRPVEFLYNELGILIGMTNVLLPFLILPLYAAMMRVDPRLMQVAETLGASRFRIFWQVFFPLTVPTLAASAILVFILSLGFYITPAVLGGGRVPLIANMMDLLINRFARWEIAAVVSVVLMVVTLSLYAVYQWLRERSP
jgi:ABC-type spermidine/putrescine transport system permease subunit I